MLIIGRILGGSLSCSTIIIPSEKTGDLRGISQNTLRDAETWRVVFTVMDGKKNSIIHFPTKYFHVRRKSE